MNSRGHGMISVVENKDRVNCATQNYVFYFSLIFFYNFLSISSNVLLLPVAVFSVMPGQ